MSARVDVSQPHVLNVSSSGPDLTTASDERPVGIFDSGIGGVTILREILSCSSSEQCLYIADSHAAPYGDKQPEVIIGRCELISQQLLSWGAKVIVVACNTASVVALEHLRARFDVPFVGIVPAVKPAAALTRSGRIGVLATPTTAESAPLAHLIETFADGLTVVTEVCPELVPLIEDGVLEGPEIDEPLRRHLSTLLEAGVDVIALGCTHYPLLHDAIETICGPSVLVLNPANAVARQLQNVLLSSGRVRTGQGALTRYFTTGPVELFRRALGLIGAPPAQSIESITF